MPERRALAAAASMALHLGALALLVLWPGAPGLERSREVVTTIALPAPSPMPPPPPKPAREDETRSATDAGYRGAVATPASILAAAIPVRLPSVAPFAEPADGEDSRGGGLTGAGAGAGATGAGAGGGERALRSGSPPVRTAGVIRDSDYPRKAAKGGQHGSVETEIAVDARGRPSACTIVRSSGSDMLDKVTCRLIMRRFRYSPARDASGHAVAGTATYDQTWVYRQADGA